MQMSQKRFPAFEDTDKMLFGKFKGELLQDVPASYLSWLFGEMQEYKEVKDAPGLPEAMRQKLKLYNYIHNAREALQQEFPDF